jgi:hypothetical protein
MHAQVAQLVEHSTENAGVGCSIQPLGTTSLPVMRLLVKIVSAVNDNALPGYEVAVA